MKPEEAHTPNTTNGDGAFLELFADQFKNQKRLMAQQQALLSRMNAELRHGEKEYVENLHEPKSCGSQQYNLQDLELGIDSRISPEHFNVQDIQMKAATSPEKPSTYRCMTFRNEYRHVKVIALTIAGQQRSNTSFISTNVFFPTRGSGTTFAL